MYTKLYSVYITETSEGWGPMWKIILYIDPNPWLVSGLLSSHIYYTHWYVYTAKCNVSTDSSLFVWLSRCTKPKQKLSLNKIVISKLSIWNSKCYINFFMCVFPLVSFFKLSTCLHVKMCYVYCVQCNVGKVCLFDYPDYLSLIQSWGQHFWCYVP